MMLRSILQFTTQRTIHSPLIKCLELIAPNLKESRTFVRTHQRPVLVILYASHEQIRDPKTQEEIPSTMFFRSGVLPNVKELENVRVPWLQVNGKCTRPLKYATITRTKINTK